MKKNKKKSNNKVFMIIGALLIISAIIVSVLLSYFEIIPITYLAMFIVIIGIIVFLLTRVLFSKIFKKWVKVVISIPSVIMTIIFLIVSLYSLGTIDFLSDIFDTGIRSDSYSVYVSKFSNYESINDLNDKIIGVVKDNDESTVKAIEKVSNKIEFKKSEFENIKDSSDALLDDLLDGVLVLDSNMEILKENDSKYNDLIPIFTFTVNTRVSTLSSNKDISKNNFVIYISGIDTSGKVATKARSDVNLLLAVNPKERKVLMVNTPRDYYVKLHSKKDYDKLTHAGIYGVEESLMTLEDLYDIDIDYYARINFTTFINIVDALGGISVDVPLSFCEQTSSRTSDDSICLNKGLQVLNGEEALALSRTRHTVSGGDRGRGKNQMLVLEAIINKTLSPEIIIKYNSLLSSVSDSLITNLDMKSLTKLIKSQIKSKTSWTFDTYSVDGSDGSERTYSTGGALAYVMKPNEETVNEAKFKLDEILETKKYTKKELAE